MKIKKWIYLMMVLGGLTPLFGQQAIDARAVGMAFSNAADTRGLEQVGLNPATLALRHRSNFEFNLLSGRATVYNNSFDRSQYDQFFTTGETLSEDDKSSLLASIPGEGLQTKMRAMVNTLAIYMPNFTLGLIGMGSGSVDMPKSVAELALYGNRDLGRNYDFSNADGSAWGGLAVNLGFAIPRRFSGNGFLEFMAIGFNGKMISGLAYADVLESRGSFQNASTENTNISVDGELQARTARGGSGYSFDLGFVGQTSERFTMSFAILNAVSSVKWDQETEMVHYTLKGDQVAITSDGFEDSLLVDKDSTYAIDPFKTRLPVVMDLGVAFRMYKKLLFTAEYEHGFSDQMGGLKGGRLAFGTEFTGVPLIPLRTGFSVGGQHGFSVALGTGLNLKILYIDLGLVNHGGFGSGKSRGLTLAGTTRLSF